MVVGAGVECAEGGRAGGAGGGDGEDAGVGAALLGDLLAGFCQSHSCGSKASTRPLAGASAALCAPTSIQSSSRCGSTPRALPHSDRAKSKRRDALSKGRRLPVIQKTSAPVCGVLSCHAQAGPAHGCRQSVAW